MRGFPLAILLLCAVTVGAQQPALPATEGSNWQRVQELPQATDLVIRLRSGRRNCKLKTVEADSLTCGARSSQGDAVLSRPDIRSIRLMHRGRSAAIGAVIGFGAAAGPTAAAVKSGYGGWRGVFAVLAGALGAAAGSGIGYATDFAGSTVYRAP